MERVVCPLCLTGESQILFDGPNICGAAELCSDTFVLRKCLRCGMAYLDPRPDAAELARFYPPDYWTPQASGLKLKLFEMFWRQINRRRWSYIVEHQPGRRLLDIGCGTGDFLSACPVQDMELYGLEPGPNGFRISRQRAPKAVIKMQKLREARFPSEFFDVVTLWHVFEHLAEPSLELDEIHRVLRDGGLLILALPNLNSLGFRWGKQHWYHLDVPRHLFHYSPQILTRLLTAYGFRSESIKYLAFEFPLDLFSSLMNRVTSDRLMRIVMTPLLLPCSLVLKLIEVPLHKSETFELVCRRV